MDEWNGTVEWNTGMPFDPLSEAFRQEPLLRLREAHVPRIYAQIFSQQSFIKMNGCVVLFSEERTFPSIDQSIRTFLERVS
jgi:hypothetical protein